MHPTELKFGIPDLELHCASGTVINPSSFVGHELVAVFCPTDGASAAQEIAAFRHHCADLVELDAWLLTFADHCDDHLGDGAGRVLTIPDLNRHAWVAFRDLTGHPEEFDRSSGATFLFTRGGNLHRYWHGSGHVDDVLAELRSPSSQHAHQIPR